MDETLVQDRACQNNGVARKCHLLSLIKMNSMSIRPSSGCSWTQEWWWKLNGIISHKWNGWYHLFQTVLVLLDKDLLKDPCTLNMHVWYDEAEWVVQMVLFDTFKKCYLCCKNKILSVWLRLQNICFKFLTKCFSYSQKNKGSSLEA